MKFTLALVAFSTALVASAIPTPQDNGKAFQRQNGLDAIQENAKFAQLSPNSGCNSGENACVNNQFAQCVNGKFVLQPCASGLVCASLPLVNSPGTSITCTTAADRDARIAATGATGGDNGNNGGNNNNNNNGGNNGGSNNENNGNDNGNDNGGDNGNNNGNNNGDNGGNNNGGGNNNDNGNNGNNNNGNGNVDLQSSLTLDPSLVQTGFESDGQDNQPGQAASLTSKNNFINFCATVNKPLTNGKQIVDGSCNAAPMGVIASNKNMPSAKFQSPKNLDTLKANTPFTVRLAIKHLTAGSFTNPQANYFSAPQTLDENGDIIGHSHIVIEQIRSLTSTRVTDPTRFAFFKGLNDNAVNGELTADVTKGLPAGVYRMATINSSANHQPALVAIAQHGSLDDMIYFTVTESGN